MLGFKANIKLAKFVIFVCIHTVGHPEHFTERKPNECEKSMEAFS